MAVIEEQLQEPAARVSAARMFQYSAYVDVGDGARECEHARDGECQDSEHFHAWCRLPNPYQHQDIRAKGLAAKAREIRALKDPSSDEAVVLEQSLADANDPAFAETLVSELVARDWAEDYLDAVRALADDERYEHIDQDREEFRRLEQDQRLLPEDEQTVDYKRLSAHMITYAQDARDKLTEIQEPKRQELRSRPFSALMELTRAKRIDELANQSFAETYNAWMWFVGTFHVERHPTLGRPYKPMWSEIGHRDRAATGTMLGEAPEVIEALSTTYNELQVALQRGSAGN